MSSPLTVPAIAFFNLLGVHTGTGTFVLSSSNVPNVSNTLGWTWPENILTGDVSWFALTLQRSTNAFNRPNASVVYAVGSNQLPAPDLTHWTNVKQWLTYDAYVADNPTPATGSYTDPWPTLNPVIYRLIANLGKGTDPVIPPFVEMTWDIAIIVPTRKITPSASGGKVTLNWDAPDVSWLPGTFRQFISYTRCPCSSGCGAQNNAYNRIIVDSHTFTAPTSYSVEKSTDGVTFNQVVAAGNILNACNEWYDSGITTPGGQPWYYRFVAHTPNEGLITSNTIFAN